MSAAKKRAVSSPEAPQAIGPYSQAVRAGGWVFVSGQIPLAPGGAEPVAGGIGAQTERCLANIAAILSAEGLGLADVVKTTVYLVDMSEFAAMNEVYGTYFQAPAPARATIQASRLPRDVRVEIDLIAYLK